MFFRGNWKLSRDAMYRSAVILIMWECVTFRVCWWSVIVVTDLFLMISVHENKCLTSDCGFLVLYSQLSWMLFLKILSVTSLGIMATRTLVEWHYSHTRVTPCTVHGIHVVNIFTWNNWNILFWMVVKFTSLAIANQVWKIIPSCCNLHSTVAWNFRASGKNNTLGSF